MSLTVLGENPKTIFLKGIENHKLHHEFAVETGNSVKKGQPVKLTATGTVVPAAADEPVENIIGHSIHNGAADELITVGMKAMGIVWASPNAAVDAGPVKYAGLNSTDSDYNAYAAVGAGAATLLYGWALDQATAADDLIRVAIV